MQIRRNRCGSVVACFVVASVLALPTAAVASPTGSYSAPIAHVAPTRDMGPCWAQAGRLVGGFYGALGTTVVNPVLGGAAWVSYLGQVGQEKRTKKGNFAC